MARQNYAFLLSSYSISICDFFELNIDEVRRVLAAADLVKYRKPVNANGSRARYFHARLMRDRCK